MRRIEFAEAFYGPTATREFDDCRDVEYITLETIHGVVFANGEPMEQSEDAVRRMVRSYVGCAE